MAQLIERACEERRGFKSKTPSAPLLDAFCSKKPLTLEIGDGVNYRLRNPLSTALDKDAPPWFQASTGAALAADYRPLVHLIIDAGRVRDTLMA